MKTTPPRYFADRKAFAARFTLWCVAAVAAVACSSKPAPDGPKRDIGSPAVTSKSASVASPSSGLVPSLDRSGAARTQALPTPGPTAVVLSDTCGPLRCQSFERGGAALLHIVPKRAMVVAFGEAHAQRDAAAVATATERFHHELLPKLAPQSSDLVLELVKPSGKCKTTAKQVASAQKPVVNRQADTNQNDFLALGHASQALNIRPHVLRPSCEQLKAVQTAGPESVERLLSLIATLTSELSRRILLRNKRQSVEKTVLTYGGALHNDLMPQPGREKWTFGPELQEFTKGRYIAIDLIVPEYIKDTDTWKKLPWVAHYDAAKMSNKVWVFETSPASYTVVLLGGVKPRR